MQPSLHPLTIAVPSFKISKLKHCIFGRAILIIGVSERFFHKII